MQPVVRVDLMAGLIDEYQVPQQATGYPMRKKLASSGLEAMAEDLW